MPCWIGLELGAVDDGPLWHKPVQFRRCGTAQQMPDKQPVPGQLSHHPNVQPVQRISSGIEVLHEIIATLHVGQHVGMQPVKRIRRHGRVVVPPDAVFDRRRAHHEFVLGRTTRELPRRAQKCPAQPQPPFAPRNRRLHQRRFDQVIGDASQPGDALMGQRLLGVHASDRHPASSRCRHTRLFLRGQAPAVSDAKHDATFLPRVAKHNMMFPKRNSAHHNR